MLRHKRGRDDDYSSWNSASSSITGVTHNVPLTMKRARRGAKSAAKSEAPHSTAQPPSQASDSSQTGPSSASQTKKSRKMADVDAPTPEKRGAIFKKACPRNILDRVERVMSQRFFMIDRQRSSEELREVFSVLGSTGNVYSVTIDHRPSCNCPDALKSNHCKHILFIFLKVLQVPQTSHIWYQKALLTSELETTFAEAPLAPNSIAHPHIREAHARATGQSSSAVEASSSIKRIPGPDDDCPICYDKMHGVGENQLVFCASCGNALHLGCFQEWRASSLRSGKGLTCVFCRARWSSTSESGTGPGTPRTTSEGYLNLGHVSGTSPIRDTSTYYHGPRRGRRYYDIDRYEEDLSSSRF